MKSVQTHRFNQIAVTRKPRSVFDLSHGHKTTIDAGFLYPIFTQEVLPADTHMLKARFFVRLQTQKVPIMDNLRMDIHYWFVPTRLVWDNWAKLNGERDNPDDSTDFVTPKTLPFVVNTGELYDYFGLPLSANMVVHNLLGRSYNLIWNEWYRDQNLQDSVTVDKGDGPDTIPTFYELLRRNKYHDYFTSCLPWPQKGDSVTLPLGTTAPVVSNDNSILFSSNGSGAAFTDSIFATDSINSFSQNATGPTGANSEIKFGSETGLQTDLTNATAATINAMREAFQVQRMLEIDSQAGTRYTEVIRAHFGVVSPDARLQRPEYLGGGQFNINVTPIAQTSETSNTPIGTLGAMGTGSGNAGFTASFTEHGYIIGLISTRADLTYQQGVPRHFSRSTRYDFYWPSFAHLGEQAVLNKEIYWSNNVAIDEDVFGYQERYAEYRYKPSQITGKFRSTALGTLDIWHLSQNFGNLPTLNSDFIEENPPMDRIIAVADEPDFLIDSYFDYKAVRPIPVHGMPASLGRF
jgi:hypothetical protein